MASFHACPVCRSRIEHFVPIPPYYLQKAVEHGFPYRAEQFETINTGAYSCPKCYSSDRDRIYALFFDALFSRLDRAKPFRFLEVAPARAFSRWVKTYPNILYRSCDLMMAEADDKADIHHLPYADNSFDFILCSHVLEHVDDPVRASSELRRVLDPQGVAVIMVPICLAISDTYENPAATTPEERWRHFGQDDHVRIFSKSGFVDVVRRGGFAVEELSVTDIVTPAACETLGLARQSVLYIAS